MRCSLFCATDGDAGRASGPRVVTKEELGALRRRELGEAARVLGIGTLVLPGHQDGKLGEADQDRFIGEIVRFLREQRPEVVITFGPEGAPTGHRDHKVISRAATAAFFLAGVATAYPDQLRIGREPWRAHRLYYKSWDPPPPDRELPSHAVEATARVDVARHLPTKREAFLAHATQRDHIGRFESLEMRDEELYALASGVAQPKSVVRDLFEGL